MLNEKLFIGKESWIVSSTWIQGRSHKTSLNPLRLWIPFPHPHPKLFCPINQAPRVACKAKYFVVEPQIYKIRFCVYLGRRECDMEDK